MNKMVLFRTFLIIIFLTLISYTGLVISKFGINLFPIFFGDILKFEWPGQFNLDFTFMLSLSCLWVLWRHRFSGIGIVLGIGAMFGGSLFLSIYLLIESIRVNGNIKALLLGDTRKDL